MTCRRCSTDDLAGRFLPAHRHRETARARPGEDPPDADLFPAEAAELAAAALADTLATALAAVALAAGAGIRLEPVLALDDEPGEWLDTALEGRRRPEVIPQVAGGLDRRLAAAFCDATAGLAHPAALLIGMDTPHVSAQLLVEAVIALLTPGTDAVLGLADDGGWWAMGVRRPDPDLLIGVPMSTADTGRLQRARLQDAGLSVARLPGMTDVDTPADAAHVAGLAPDSRFAGVLRRLAAATPR